MRTHVATWRTMTNGDTRSGEMRARFSLKWRESVRVHAIQSRRSRVPVPRCVCVVTSRKRSLECTRAKAVWWRLVGQLSTNCDDSGGLDEYECRFFVIQSAATHRMEQLLVSRQLKVADSGRVCQRATRPQVRTGRLHVLQIGYTHKTR
jgi:hypothetical protein